MKRVQPDRGHWTHVLLGLTAQVQGPKWQLSTIPIYRLRTFTASLNGLEGTTVGHLVQLPCSGSVIPEHTARDCAQMFFGCLQ